jgi:signal transduction histidine kinase
MSACTNARHAALPAGLVVRLTRFTELVATAVSNATARADLIESRARLVAAGDEARRRIERDLHDGTQQRLIALGLDLQRIRGLLRTDPGAAAEGLEHTQEDLEVLLEEVRQLSSSLHPPLLSLRGFVPALRSLARRSSIPVDIDVELRDRPPPAIESALYYVASEAITNAMKHSQATTISVIVETDHVGWPFGIGIDGRRTPGKIYATIVDDGVGGADVTAGSGLSGLVDRVDALGGRFTLDSVPGNGTRISVVLPLDPA